MGVFPENRHSPQNCDSVLIAAVQHHQSGRFDDADCLYKKIICTDPSHGKSMYFLGVLFGMKGNFQESIKMIIRSIFVRESDVDSNLSASFAFNGVHHYNSNDIVKSIVSFNNSMAIDPENTTTIKNVGKIYQEIGKFDKSIELYRRSLSIDGCDYEALYGIGVCYKSIGLIDLAISYFKMAIAVSPNSMMFRRHILWAILCSSKWNDSQRFHEHRRFSIQYSYSHHDKKLPVTDLFSSDRCDPDRRLKIGYLSSDFYNHPVSHNIEPLLFEGDPQKTSIYMYAILHRSDAMTEKLRSRADVWRDVTGKNDAEIAHVMRQDGIDVLIVLAGRFNDNRPLVASYRPAPVQISLFDAATSGVSEMDYILTDRVMTPRLSSEQFTERPIRLPTLFVYHPLKDSPPVEDSPICRNGFITFASFNNPSKINDDVLILWANVMLSVPSSILILKYKNFYESSILRNRITILMDRYGVEKNRITFLFETQSRYDHLNIYNNIDISLDSFPFSGATTSFESLWMGVPVITLPQSNMMSRWSMSLLSAIKLDNLIANSADNYIEISSELSKNHERLSELRSSLRSRLVNSTVCNGSRQARHFDRVLRAVWRRWCRLRGNRVSASGLSSPDAG